MTIIKLDWFTCCGFCGFYFCLCLDCFIYLLLFAVCLCLFWFDLLGVGLLWLLVTFIGVWVGWLGFCFAWMIWLVWICYCLFAVSFGDCVLLVCLLFCLILLIFVDFSFWDWLFVVVLLDWFGLIELVFRLVIRWGGV